MAGLSEGTLLQVVSPVAGVLVALFTMQRQRYSLQLKMLAKKHDDEMEVVSEKRKLAHAVVESHEQALKRFERDKDELTKSMETIQAKIGWLEEIIPQTHDLLRKIHTHFEKRKAQASEVIPTGPDSVLVRDKKE